MGTPISSKFRHLGVSSQIGCDENARPRVVFAVTSSRTVPLLGSIPKLMAEHGWDVHIIGDIKSDFLEDATSHNISYHHVRMERGPAPIRDLFSLWHALAFLKTIRPKLLVTASPKASLLFGFGGFLCRTPQRVYWLIGLRLETVSGYLRRFLWLSEKLTSLLSHKVLAASASLKRRYLEEKLCDPRKISVLGHGSTRGVDLSVFRPAREEEKTLVLKKASQLGLSEDVPVIGYFGRIHADKGIDILDSSRVILGENGVDHQLLVVGDNEYPGFSFTSRENLRDPIVLESVPDPWTFYHLVDIFCLPTFREGLPNVCLEASASAVPVITTDATGAIDSVENGLNGIVVKVGSVEQLAAALENLLKSERTRSEISSRARDWVSSRFQSHAVADAHLEYFSSLDRELEMGGAMRTYFSIQISRLKSARAKIRSSF